MEYLITVNGKTIATLTGESIEKLLGPIAAHYVGADDELQVVGIAN